MSFRIPFPLQHEPPEKAPVPTGAVWNGALQVMTVSFDKPLVAGELDASNWSVQIPFNSIVASGASSSGSEVVLQFANVSQMPLSVTYAPPPFDVVGVNGLAVEAFSLPV